MFHRQSQHNSGICTTHMHIFPLRQRDIKHTEEWFTSSSSSSICAVSQTKHVFQTLTSFSSFRFPRSLSQTRCETFSVFCPFWALCSFVSLSLLLSIFCLFKQCAKPDLEVMALQSSTMELCLLPLPLLWFRSKLQLQGLSAVFSPLQAVLDGFQRSSVPPGSEGTDEELLCC